MAPPQMQPDPPKSTDPISSRRTPRWVTETLRQVVHARVGGKKLPMVPGLPALSSISASISAMGAGCRAVRAEAEAPARHGAIGVYGQHVASGVGVNLGEQGASVVLPTPPCR